MGNFYKDQERAKIVITRVCDNLSGSSEETIYREVRCAGFPFGRRIIAELIQDLVYKHRIAQDGSGNYITPFYYNRKYGDVKSVSSDFDREVAALGLGGSK